MTVHHMKLHSRPFAEMTSGTKRSELRLNDEKRQLVSVGDEIVFTNRENESQTVRTTVTYLNTYPTFKALYQGVKKDYPNWDESPFIESLYSYYSQEEEAAFGALEIGVALLPNS